MKPTSPLSLLLFLQLHVAATAPIPTLYSFPPDYPRTSCAPSLHAFLTIGKPSTPPTRINSNPHSPAHQLAVDGEDPYDEAFNNAPITPPIHVAPTEALFSDKPLESSYLRSLSNPATSPTLQHSPHEVEPHTAVSLPAKPTSALPKLRKEETKIYLASLLPASIKGSQDDEEESIIREGPLKRPSRKPCGLNSGRQYMLVKSQSIFEARDYSDFMVVGIVVLFLVLVVLAEAAEKVGNLSIFGNRRTDRRRGEIFLEDDETVAFIVKKPLCIQAKSPPCYTTSEKGMAESITEKEAFKYDSDASERGMGFWWDSSVWL